MKERLFIGIPVPKEIKEVIIKKINFPPNFNITNKENLHITILFLGDIESEIIKKIILNLNNTLKNTKGFEINISKYDQFPHKGYPKIVYLTGEKGVKELIELTSNIRNNLGKLIFLDNKDFKYHITVARCKYQANNFINLSNWNDELSFYVDTIILYKSILNHKGPVYIPLYEWKLL